METSKGDDNLVMIPENTRTMNNGEENHIENEKKLISTSSSSSSSSGESFELVGTGDTDLFTFEVVAPNSDNAHTSEATTLKSDNLFLAEVPISTTPGHEANNDQTTFPTQSPPTQAMDREPETAESVEAYRIPSSIFTRTKSSAQGDWSTASNESLFSIHMGNASFTKDHANWFGCSGELGLINDVDPTIDYSSNQPPSVQAQITKSNEENPNTDEVKAAETMREVIRENEVDPNSTNSKDHLTTKISLRTNSFRRSDASQASIKSFAFPILTGDHKESQKHRVPPQPPSPSPPQPPSQPQSPKIEHSQSKQNVQAATTPTPPPPPPPPPNKWFSCLFCCSSCSS
ncbi:hypothetical protein M5689_006290 [Euphorbia peplus]|nr:hypothetical protein M5689_006290 [Euphorbia peplus]